MFVLVLKSGERNFAIDIKSENILILLTLILWFRFCIFHPSLSFPPSPYLERRRRRRRQTFYYYDDVVNGTITKDFSLAYCKSIFYVKSSNHPRRKSF